MSCKAIAAWLTDNVRPITKEAVASWNRNQVPPKWQSELEALLNNSLPDGAGRGDVKLTEHRQMDMIND